MTLAKLQSNPPGELGESVEALKELFQQNQQVARDSKRAVADRVAAVELLAYQPFDEAAPALRGVAVKRSACRDSNRLRQCLSEQRINRGGKDRFGSVERVRAGGSWRGA